MTEEPRGLSKDPGRGRQQGHRPQVGWVQLEQEPADTVADTQVYPSLRWASLVHSGPQPAAGICRRALTFFSSRMKSSTRVLTW